MKMGPARRKETQRKVIPKDPLARVDYQDDDSKMNFWVGSKMILVEFCQGGGRLLPWSGNEVVFIEDEGAFGLFQTEENDIWRNDNSEVKGIFKMEAPKHTTPCSSGAVATILVIFLTDMRLEAPSELLQEEEAYDKSIFLWPIEVSTRRGKYTMAKRNLGFNL
ncbi:hypothetical protein TIFTF001_016598 [Ficus carica]|uniref:Uncharacterized protein n=1 Tax=Ficus carica TaxID=3494 RepID=A0AA88A955_FICCA|nr:hypothetical protein TIFTF001_016598 [Ficus carica]